MLIVSQYGISLVINCLTENDLCVNLSFLGLIYQFGDLLTGLAFSIIRLCTTAKVVLKFGSKQALSWLFVVKFWLTWQSDYTRTYWVYRVYPYMISWLKLGFWIGDIMYPNSYNTNKSEWEIVPTAARKIFWIHCLCSWWRFFLFVLKQSKWPFWFIAPDNFPANFPFPTISKIWMKLGWNLVQNGLRECFFRGFTCKSLYNFLPSSWPSWAHKLVSM